MFAAALAWAQGIDTGIIRTALSAFDNSMDQNPGRYNFVDGLPFDVLVDFAHNPDGMRGICSAAAALPRCGPPIAVQRQHRQPPSIARRNDCPIDSKHV